MAFVNEYVPEEDVKKYNLAVIDKNYFKGHYKPDWTRNKEKDIYLRWMGDGGQEGMEYKTFSFYWKGTLLQTELTHVRHEGDSSNSKVWRLRGIVPPWWEKNQELRVVAQHVLQENITEILVDLKSALTVYQDAGVYSLVTNLIVTFEF